MDVSLVGPVSGRCIREDFLRQMRHEVRQCPRLVNGLCVSSAIRCAPGQVKGFCPRVYDGPVIDSHRAQRRNTRRTKQQNTTDARSVTLALQNNICSLTLFKLVDSN